MNKKVKVLMVNHEFPPIGGGGGTTTRFLAKHLVKLGIDVSIISAKPGKDSYIEHEDGFKIYYIGPEKKNYETSHIPEMTGFILTSLLKADKLIKEIKPDLIHCFFTIPAGCFGLYCKKIYDIPFLASTLGADVPGFNIGDWKLNAYHSLTHNISKSIWKNTSHLVANSNSLKILCERFSPKQKIEMITNGVDTDIFYPSSSTKSNNTINLLFISRLSLQKGIEPLIKACGELKNLGVENYKLTIVGDGPLKERMFSLIDELKIKDKVDFKGWLKLEELPEIYRDSDVFLLPSVMEGMPSVVLQAMASGLPVIGSKVEGFSEVLEDNINGFCVEYGDYKAIASAIAKLIDSPELRNQMSKKSIEKANIFSWESISKQYLTLYENMLPSTSLQGG